MKKVKTVVYLIHFIIYICAPEIVFFHIFFPFSVCFQALGGTKFPSKRGKTTKETKAVKRKDEFVKDDDIFEEEEARTRNMKRKMKKCQNHAEVSIPGLKDPGKRRAPRRRVRAAKGAVRRQRVYQRANARRGKKATSKLYTLLGGSTIEML